MAVTYCTAAQLASFLQVPTFGVGTTPTQSVVEAFINEAEDQIDQETGHAWRTVTVTNEYHDAPINRRNTIGGRWMAIPLKHRSIKTLDGNSNDAVEVWDGSQYVDYIASANYSEGRANDYWVDYTNGVLYIRPWRFSDGEKAIRITYRYGEATVPSDIKKATIYLAATQVLQGDDRSVLLPEGTNNIPLTDKASRWEESANKIINKRKELIQVFP